MRKRKVLFVTEAHFHPTGYSVYTKEVLSRLHKHPELEVAELACFVGPEAPELKNSPWKIYPNMPAADNQAAMDAYNSSMSNKFGEFSLNSVLVDFQPDFVMDIRDVWMCLRAGTKIMTPEGAKNVEQVEKGNVVLTHNGRYRNVLDTFSRDYSGDMYEFKTHHNLYPVHLTEGHPVFVCEKNSHRRLHEKNAQWVKSENVREGDFLCFPVLPYGDVSETPELSLLRGYFAAFTPKRKKSVLAFRVPLNQGDFVKRITDAFQTCYPNGKIRVETGKNHHSVSLKAGKKFVQDVNDFQKILRLDALGSTHFVQAYLMAKFEIITNGERGRIKVKDKELRDVIFQLCLRYKALPRIARNMLQFYESHSVNNLGFLSGKTDATHIKNHPKIRDRYAFFKINKINKEKTSERVYNFEVEEDNSYVSSFAIHNCEHIERSPFRDFFNFALMPTVDAEPQNPQWISVFAKADAIFAYSEFGRDTMLKQNRHINFVDVASPCASDTFVPMDKKQIRKEFNLDENAIIFGTVMRNQRRKLFPSLFKAFRLYLDNNPEHDNVYLYCHTGYPDVGWDIPALIIEHGLASKVLLTYKCRHCGKVTASFFNDAVKTCSSCGNLSNQIVGIGNKMDESDLAKIYNLFDVYIQWANSEGYGMSQPEAARCGLPVVSMNYSAMESFVKNVEGVEVDPLGFYKELETGCNRAVPDEEALAHVMYRMVSFPDYRKAVAEACYTNYHKIYHWDKTAKVWADYFLSQPIKDEQSTWKSPPRIFSPAQRDDQYLSGLPVSEQANWLFINVLGKPEWIGGAMWQRMTKDLTYRLAVSQDIPGYYINDLAHPDIERKYQSFDIQKAYEMCFNLRTYMNQWEQVRYEKNKVHQ